MLITVIACPNDQVRKYQVNNSGSKRKEQVQSCVTHFFIMKTKQWYNAFNDPEKKNTAHNEQRALPGMDVVKKSNEFFHIKHRIDK